MQILSSDSNLLGELATQQYLYFIYVFRRHKNTARGVTFRASCCGILSRNAHMLPYGRETIRAEIIIVYVNFILYSVWSNNRKAWLCHYIFSDCGLTALTWRKRWRLALQANSAWYDLHIKQLGGVYCLTLKIPFDLGMIWYKIIGMHLSVDHIIYPNFYHFCL